MRTKNSTSLLFNVNLEKGETCVKVGSKKTGEETRKVGRTLPVCSVCREKRRKDGESNKAAEIGWVADRGTTPAAVALDYTGSVYLAQVAGDAHVMPGVVVELAVDGLHQGLECPRAQVDDQPDRAALQGKVHVVCRLAGVQHEAVALQRAEGKRDLVGAALDGRQRQVVAEELVALEGGYRFFLTWRGKKEGREKGKLIKRIHECRIAQIVCPKACMEGNFNKHIIKPDSSY